MRCPTISDLPEPPPGKIGWPWTVDSPQVTERRSDGEDWPRISIVTPSYNQSAFIEQTIRSVLLQGYPDLEYIVVDGGSTDGSVDIIKKYERWLAYWVSERDGGQGNAINKGFRRATGSLYGWINSDDFYFWGALGQVGRMSGYTRRTLYYGDAITIRNPEGTVSYFVGSPVRKRFLTRGGIIHQPSSFWTSTLHQPIREDLACAVDSELWFRLVPQAEKCRYIRYPLGITNLHAETKTDSERTRDAWAADNALIGELHGLHWPNRPLYWLYRKSFKSALYDLDWRLTRAVHVRLNRTRKNVSLCNERLNVSKEKLALPDKSVASI
jgi:glycosyltransferase involved in cell wall biosynthesis